jgi:hypothetical protein
MRYLMANAFDNFLVQLRAMLRNDAARLLLLAAIARWHEALPEVAVDDDLPEWSDPDARIAALYARSAKPPRKSVRFPLPPDGNESFEGDVNARLVALAALYDAANIRDGRGNTLVGNVETYPVEGPLRHYAHMVAMWLGDLKEVLREFKSMQNATAADRGEFATTETGDGVKAGGGESQPVADKPKPTNEQLLASIPPLDKASGDWIGDYRLLRVESKSGSRRTMRSAKGSIRSEDGLCGVDKAGRWWRKDPSKPNTVFYYRFTLKSVELNPRTVNRDE